MRNRLSVPTKAAPPPLLRLARPAAGTYSVRPALRSRRRRPPTTTTTPAAAPALDWGNSQVDVVYAEPQNPQFLPIRDRLMRRQVLEQLRLFLSPLRLPRKLLVQIDQCNAEQRPYQPGGPVTICYEYVAKVDQIAPRNAPAGGLPRETMIVGAFIQAVLHDVAVATFDILELPVWGRERTPPISSPASSWCSSARTWRKRS